MKLKVGIISSSYHPYYRGGGEYSAKALAEGLKNKGVEVFIITAYHQTQEDQVEGVKVYRIKHPNIYWSFDSEKQTSSRKLAWHIIEGYNIKVEKPLKKILKKENPDVLHIRNVEDFSPYSAKVAHRMGIPVVITLNSYTWLCPKATMFRNKKNCDIRCLDCKVITLPKKYLSSYVDAVVGVSQFMLDKHAQYGYFPNAIRDVIYTSALSTHVSLPCIQNGYKTIGYIGRIHPSKGVDQLIKAFINCANDTDHQLFVAGEGPDEYVEKCKRMAGSNTRIHFLGKVKTEDFYPKIDAVIINSLWHEPFPRVLVEAYAYGRPVLASSKGGTAEMIMEQQTGYVYNPFKLQELQHKLAALLLLDETDMLRFQEQVEQFYHKNFPDQIQKHILLYTKLLSMQNIS